MKLIPLPGRFARLALFVSFLLLSLLPAVGAEPGALPPSTCPPVDPKADFVTNFNKPCYATPLFNGAGLGNSGDANATYDDIFFVVTKGYELVLLGTYTNGRFQSVTVYDEHLAVTSGVNDQSILPLNSTMTNPFGIGAVYQPAQQYGVTIGFGNTLTQTPRPGCSANDTTIDQNFLDASQIHAGLSWNDYPNIGQYGLPVHTSGPNNSGLLMVRKYMDLAQTGTETVIVRDTTTGCALGARDALTSGIISLAKSLGSSTLLDQPQIAAHQTFSNTIEQLECYQADPNNTKQWFRSVDYVPLANTGASLDLNINSSNLALLLAGQNFLRLRFPAPTTPNIPCAAGGCWLTGNEDLRYYSISFLGAPTPFGRTTLTSLSDNSFVQDPNGNVTLLVGLGAAPPTLVTTANFYNYLDLTAIANYASLSRIEIRHLLPGTGFGCSNANVPLFTMEFNPKGGYMGEFVPTVDFPTGANLTAPAPPPPTRANTCSLIPHNPPKQCGPSQ